jgi:tetratricopeptide (TPR) repeat protein
MQHNEPAQARQLFTLGTQAAQEALASGSAYSVEAHFWYGVNHIEAARLQGKIASARALGDATRHIERAAAIDETYHFAGPLRVLGRIMHMRPLLLGGDLNKAVDFLRRALQVSPDNSTTMLYLAEALFADRQLAETRSVVKRIIEGAPDPAWQWEQARDRKAAQAILDKMNQN